MEPRPGRWHTREDSGIRLDRDLKWWHDNEPVEHPKIVEAFNVGLRPRDDGKFELRIGDDWCLVEVEDAAFGVRRVEAASDGTMRLSLSDRTEEPLVPATLTADPRGVLECRVKSGHAKARFSREAQFALGSMLEHDAHGWSLKPHGERTAAVPLPGLASLAALPDV